MKQQTGWLSKNEVRAAIRRTGNAPRRIPLVRTKWWGDGLVAQYGAALDSFADYPEDAIQIFMAPLRYETMRLSWPLPDAGSYDNTPIIDEWSKLDEFIEKLPRAENDERWEPLAAQADTARKQDRYLLFSWWHLFFERAWVLRGMENLMVDYYEEPEHVHRLHNALTDLYEDYISTAVRYLRPDGFFTSDDLGHQKGPMMSPGQFREHMVPYYHRIGTYCHSHDLDFWLHSCGDNTALLPDLIASGVDVFHPVQKHTMDEEQVAADFGGKISFMAGIDVQHVLQESDPEGVRREVRFLVDTFARPDGGLCLAAGNGIVAGTPLENIRAFLDEALHYQNATRRTTAT